MNPTWGIVAPVALVVGLSAGATAQAGQETNSDTLSVDAGTSVQVAPNAATTGASAECGPTEGPAVKAPLGLTVCRAPTASRVRIEPEPQPGARIVVVEEGGLARRAGLVANDVIYRVDGERVSSGSEALERLARVKSPGLLQINYWRDGLPYIARIWMGAAR
jgi:S1-C subfamily serine protease